MQCLLSRRAFGRTVPALVLSALVATSISVLAADRFASTSALVRVNIENCSVARTLR